MKVFLLLLLVTVMAQEMLVTKYYSEYLKKHVDWEVVDYEDNIFRGWTIDEFKEILLESIPKEGSIPETKVRENLPSSINWASSRCDHGVINQGNCGSCWAISVAGMLSDRCCLQGHDHGWLSAQEIISCDDTAHGCRGGWPRGAIEYVIKKGGLVLDACFPYSGRDIPCPTKCVDGSDLEKSRFCNCVGGYSLCNSVDKMKTCLQAGPVTAAFGVCRSFINYKSGIYRCDCKGKYMGIHLSLVMGYSNSPSDNYFVKNTWGVAWGNKGYFNIGINECGISGTYEQGNVACAVVKPQFIL